MKDFNKTHFITHEYYKVHYAHGSYDCATCKTLDDAKIRQEEIKQNQLRNGYEPEKTKIYRINVSVMQDDEDFIISRTETMTVVD